jgi:hypothetical protein
MLSSVAAIQRITGWQIQLWMTTCPVVLSYQRGFKSSVATPSWTSRLTE